MRSWHASLCVCMRVCVYACMRVCVYACMYVCIYGSCVFMCVCVCHYLCLVMQRTPTHSLTHQWHRDTPPQRLSACHLSPPSAPQTPRNRRRTLHRAWTAVAKWSEGSDKRSLFLTPGVSVLHTPLPNPRGTCFAKACDIAMVPELTRK